MKCIYCNEDKPLDAFSLEHIFPSSIGGKLCDEFFKTRAVCRPCNSRAGARIDGPFLKGALSKNVFAQAQMDFVDPGSSSSWAPFFYKGKIMNLELASGDICERWEGAHGEHVYHAHEADSSDFDAYAGGSPQRRREQPGRAYLFLTDPDSGKASFTIRSFERQFKTAERYAGNFFIEVEGQRVVAPVPELRQAEFDLVKSRAMSREPTELRMALDLSANERFLAKLARALGYKLFGDAYVGSPYGERVRQAMYERNFEKRQGLAYYLTEAPGMQQVAKFVHIPGAYSVYLFASERGFVLGLVMPSGEGFFITVSDEPELWSGSDFDRYRLGVAYVVAPGAGLFAGPIDFPEFHAHVAGIAPHEKLEELERRRFGVVKPVGHQFTSLKEGG